VFEYSIRDFFECQNVVEACWFEAFFTQFCEAFKRQKFRHAEFLMLESEALCLSTQSAISLSLNTMADFWCCRLILCCGHQWTVDSSFYSLLIRSCVVCVCKWLRAEDV